MHFHLSTSLNTNWKQLEFKSPIIDALRFYCTCDIYLSFSTQYPSKRKEDVQDNQGLS